MKQNFLNLKEIWSGFLKYIIEHPLLGGIVAAVLSLVYGGQAFSNHFYIDAEVILNHPGSLYNWEEIGRFSLVWFKKLLGLVWYNPYLEGALFLVMLWITAMGMAFLFSYIDHRVRPLLAGIFSLIFLLYPTFAEQFLFQFQAFEVVFGMFLLIVSSCYLIQYIREKNLISFLLSIFLLIFSFGIYQSMVNLQICFYFGMFLFLLLVEKEDGKIQKRMILFSIIQFLVALLLYQGISKLFYTQSDYLSGKISWKTEGFSMSMHRILNYMGEVFLGENVFYPVTYGVSVCFLGVFLLILIFKKKQQAIWYLLGGISLIISPFFLSIITGSSTVYRAQLMIPFVCAVNWLFLVHGFTVLFKGKGKEILIRCFIFLGVTFILVQVAPLMRLFYTRDVIGRGDLISANEMIEDIYEVPSVFGGKPVIFIGHRVPTINGSCYTHSQAPTYLCNSVFELDYQAEPQFYYSTHRILGYFETLGFYFVRPTMEMVEEAKEKSVNNVCWPLEGSVVEYEDYVVVKLSN